MSLQIKPGKYRTRDGMIAVVLCTDAPGQWPIKGYVLTQSGGSSSNGWRLNGQMYERNESRQDLVAEYVEPREWTLTGHGREAYPSRTVGGPPLLEGEIVRVREILDEETGK